jgi:hypothetical protein
VLVLFGRKDRLAIECELTDTSRPYFFGKVRVWFGGIPLGDFSGEIISTQVFAAEELWRVGQGGSAPADLVGCPAEVCVAELGALYERGVGPEDAGERWRRYDFTNRFPYFGRTLCLLLPLESGHRVVLGLASGAIHEVRLEAGDLDAACLGFSAWVQGQLGYGAGSRLSR